jgi:YD repeat-containing protein
LYWQVEAGQERYDYDGLGRLIRRVDSQNKATEYTYDPAGNILRVASGADPVQAPSISSVTPATIRRSETKQLVVVGANLTSVTVSADDADHDIYDVQTAAGEITLTLSVSANATLGTRLLRLSSAAGSANGAITVAPVLPKLTFEPTPLAIPPDNVARQVTLRLSNADVIDHTIALAASSTKITVSPAQLTFAAGQTTAKALVTGVTAGTADILASSATLGASGVPVYVTADFRGISTSYNKPLGVVLEAPPSSAGKTVSPIASQLLGVAVGNHVSAVSPSALAVGSSAQINL